MNILIKLTCLVGLVIAPILGNSGHDEATTPTTGQTEQSVEVKKVVLTDANGANVEIEEKTENGIATTSILSGDINKVSDQDLLQLKNDGFDLSEFIPAQRWNNLGKVVTSIQ